MSLRTRLITSIVIVLLVSLSIGCGSAGWNAARSIRTEMQAALHVAAQTVQHGLDDLPESPDPQADLSRLVLAFNGDRHVCATLLDRAGRAIVISAVSPAAQAVPQWFVHLVAPKLPAARLAAETARGRWEVVLDARPLNEVGETWVQLGDSLAVLTLFCTISIVVVSLVVTQALRPLGRISAALAAVGSGQYALRLPPAATADLARLTDGFNTMVARLGVAEAQNRRLLDQISTLQEEERADIARNLHDEVGPFLFVAALDAAAIEQASASGRYAAIPERARAIREAVGHMQHHVRGLLKRLRLASPVDIGLSPALEKLVAFWQAHRPSVVFTLIVTVDEDALNETTKAVIYRVMQEGLSNAIRHGRPAAIALRVAFGPDGMVVVSISDDGVGIMDGNEMGLGLAGMRERVAGLGGALHVANRPGGGLSVTARLPGRTADSEILQPVPL